MNLNIFIFNFIYFDNLVNLKFLFVIILMKLFFFISLLFFKTINAGKTYEKIKNQLENKKKLFQERASQQLKNLEEL